MKTILFPFMLLAACGLVLSLTACSNNVRWYETEEARFWCSLWSKPAGSDYHILELGPTNELRNHGYDISIRFNNGHTEDLRNLDIARIQGLSGNLTEASDGTKHKYPAAQSESRIEAYTFILSSSNLLAFKATYFHENDYYSTNRAVISSSLTTNWFQFPLTEDQVREVLGEPERINDFWMN